MKQEDIQKYAENIGLNHVEQIDIENREIYALSLLDNNDEPVPTGLPYFIEVKNDKITKLSVSECFKLMNDE